MRVCSCACSVVSDSFATQWTIACQASLSRGFPRQEYLSELPCPLPGDLPDPGVKPDSPASPALQADSLPADHLGTQVGNDRGTNQRIGGDYAYAKFRKNSILRSSNNDYLSRTYCV